MSTTPTTASEAQEPIQKTVAQRLVDFKEAYITAATAIDKLKEPLVQLIQIREFLDATIRENLMTDTDWAKFVNEDICPGMAKRLSKEKSYQENYLAAVAALMEGLILVFISELQAHRYNESFIAGMTFVFQPECSLHNYHYQIASETLKHLRTSKQTWRKDLKVGDKLDVLVKADEKSPMTGFMQAIITRVEGDTLFLEFPESSNFYDTTMDRWATQICAFESKTKEDYAWRRDKLENAKDYEIDAHDKSSWLKATILETKQQTIGPDRVITLAYIAYRVYRQKANQIRKDERGTYEGWSSKFDEWIPIYSPRLMPWQTRQGVTNVDDDDLEEEIDDLVEPEPGMKRVFAVPRVFKCISSQFLHFINLFGNSGGFDTIIDILENAKLDDNSNLTISVMGCLAQIVTLPSVVLHKDIVTEYGQRIAQAIRNRLLQASDKSLRDIRKDQIDAILKSVENISRRFLTKDEREKQSEVLKLEMCNKNLNSEFLERRINAIKDLNSVLWKNSFQTSKAFTTEFLIDWMMQQQVFTTIWDSKKTHIQLVQRSNDIFKLLMKEDKMSVELCDLFWNLTNTPAYKSEVFKILNETAFHLKTSHIEYFYNKITQTPNDKLSMEEFNALSELGKYCKNQEFMTKVSNFFWKIITEATYHTDELIENCIKKFTEMVQFWTIESKWPMFEALVDQLKVTEHPSLPVIRVFKKMIKDQKERATSSSSTTVATSGTYTGVSSYPASSVSESVYDMGASGETQISTVSAAAESNEPSKSHEESSEKELTFEGILNNLDKDKQLVQTLLSNLTAYCNLVQQKVAADSKLAKADRTKLYFYPNKSASHAEEISERLQFLNYYAQVSSFVISKVQLKVIYDLLSHSPINSDLTEFLIWCKQACESSTHTKTIMNLEEVGEFYSDLIKTGQLDVVTLPMVGFEFLQQYFISVNENNSNLLRVKKDKPKATTNYSQNTSWKSYFLNKNENEVVTKEDSEPAFRIVIHPSMLEKSEMIWTVVLQSQNAEVVQKAVNFLIKTYLSLDEGLTDQAAKIQQDLIEKCMTFLQDEKSSPKLVQRVIFILKSIVKESEKHGTGGVQPHNAILKGELLNRIIIKNHTTTKPQNLIVAVYTSATVWEFVTEVSKMLWLSPKHVQFRLSDNKIIDESMHGMVLAQLGLKQGDVISASKVHVEEDAPVGKFVDENKQFTPAAKAIFEEWWDVYKEEGTNDFTPNSAVRFIKGCTHEDVQPDDSRIDGLFKIYDKEKTGKMSKDMFMDFFLKACTDRLERVLENLKCHNIRPDMKKIYEVSEECEFTREQMPRYTMSANQRHFDTLMDVLDKNKEAEADAWDLIRMLATNQEMYRSILTLKDVKDSDTGIIDWYKFFNGTSVYKQIYNFEIIEAVMNESESSNDHDQGDRRVFFVEYQDTGKKKNKAGWLPPQLKDKQHGVHASETDEQQHAMYQQLKLNWTKQFVEQHGIDFVFKQVLSLDFGQANQTTFELKNKSFLLTLLRVFIIAAIAAQPDQDMNASMQLLKRKSSVVDVGEEKKEQETESAAIQQLIALLKDTHGTELLLSLDFEQLQTQIMRLVSTVLVQDAVSIDEKQIVENAMSLWVGIINYKPSLFGHFQAYEGSNKVQTATNFIMWGVLYCKEEKIRQDFKSALSAIGRHENALSFLIKILSANFNQIDDYPCVQFFELYNELIDLFYTKQALGSVQEQNVFNPESLLSFIIDKMRADKKSTTSPETEEDDIFAKEKAEISEKFRIGLINLMCKIITKVEASVSIKIVQEKDLIREIFREFLFASFYEQDQPASDKHSHIKLSEKKKKKSAGVTQNNKSREAAYSLLLQLIMKSPILMGRFIKEQLGPLLDKIKKPNKWNFQPPGQSAAMQKYVGLKNLGCICYMNSMMQQFFMTPAFRYNILCVNDGIPEDNQEYKGETFDDNMLHQLQRLIAHLELSERQDYNPKGFCFAFKETDQNTFKLVPTNTSEQKDAQEFLNVLFDRLDNALKPTSRKYLLQSIFGGKQCSQMVCTECGKVKNRLEDFYNLSLTVKDIKSVYDSLDQQVKGEMISDYFCEQCNRKVELSKRTLIAETPNVLIVHLQRIVFNFDTFRNDKINSMFKFPPVLDLKPYSYYDVMGREGRLPKKKEDGAEEEEEVAEEKKDEDFVTPIEDDCYEYKLVGVNMHSGSANAGHYWSYINTNRSVDEDDQNPNWIKTNDDPWMEFNDSRVSDFQYSKLDEESFGEEASSYSAWNYGGGAYGKSAYMLFYERRKKKGLKILVPDEQVEEVKAQGVTVHYDDKTKEHFKMVNYREGAENEKPSEIYSKVFEDNSAVSFENDIYSQEFFDFIKQILEKVASYADAKESNHELNLEAIKVAKKSVIDILSRCFNNGGMKQMVSIMIDIFKKDDDLCKNFVASLLEEANAECIMEIMFECTDKVAQANVARLIKYLLCRLKVLEKDDLLSDAVETITEKVEKDGKEEINEHQLPKAVCSRFMNVLLFHLKDRAAKSWSRFDYYLDVIKAFGINSAEDIEKEVDQAAEQHDLKSESARVGLEYYFKQNVLERLMDFILQDASPLRQPGEKRIAMGSSFVSVNFTSLIKLITIMMSEHELIAKYPMSAAVKQMIASKDMLSKMMEPSGSNDSSKEVIQMCLNNLSMSKKVAKLLIKGINQYQVEKVTKYLRLLKKFLRLDDEHKMARIEWTLGVPQLHHKKQFRMNTYQYGVELVDKINDEAYTYETPLFKGSTSEDALLTQLLKIRRQQESICMIALKCLLKLCVNDPVICKYLYKCAPPTYSYVNYSGWFRSYFTTHRTDLEKATSSNVGSYSSYYENRMTVLVQAEEFLAQYDEICRRFAEEEKAAFESKPENAFVGLSDTWMAYNHEDVIPHFPPQLIVGKQVGEERVIHEEENDSVIVRLVEVDCEWMYSNPTGLFNLSIPDKAFRTQNYSVMSYEQYKNYQWKQKQQQLEQTEGAESTIQEPEPLVVKNWNEQHLVGPVLLRIDIESKVQFLINVKVKLSVEGDQKNVQAASTPYVENVFANDVRAAAVFVKTDPSKEEWGQLTLSFSVKRPAMGGVGASHIATSANWGQNGSALRNNIIAAHSIGTGFFKPSLGEQRRNGAVFDGDATATQPQEAGGMDSDKADASNDAESNKGFDNDDVSPVICVHCDAVNRGDSLYCINSACGKILTQYSYDVAGNLD